MDAPGGASFRLDRLTQHLVEAALSAQPVTEPAPPRVALVVGVGPRNGLGGAITARIAREGYHVFALGRTRSTLEQTAADIKAEGLGQVTPIVLECIGASGGFEQASVNRQKMEQEIVDAFAKARSVGRLDLVVQNQGPNMLPPTGRDMRDMTMDFMQYMWDMNMLISFLVGREAARCMVPREKSQQNTFPLGTVVFIGATASLRGKPPFVAFAQGKAGVRLLAQSMSREYGPKGLHVAHLVVDGIVDGSRIRSMMPNLDKDTGVGVDSTAETVWQLSVQDPSAWTHELEVRPFKETW